VIRKQLLPKPSGSLEDAEGDEQPESTMGPMGPGSKFRRLPSRFPSAENIAALVAGGWVGGPARKKKSAPDVMVVAFSTQGASKVAFQLIQLL
jgi:hypothetical protein